MDSLQRARELYNEALHQSNESDAISLLKVSSDLGFGPASRRLAYLYSRDGYRKKNDDFSFHQLLKGAYQGDPHSMYVAGMRYYLGIGSKKHMELARYWIFKAASSNLEAAKHFQRKMFNEDIFKQALKLYKLGKYEEAIPLFQNVALHKMKNGYSYLGDIYYNGLGVQQNIDRAICYYLGASELGSCVSMHNIGCIFYKRKEYQKAKKWFIQAAKRGNGLSAYNLGVMYHKGIGVEINEQKSIDYFIEATKFGNRKAMYYLAYYYSFLVKEKDFTEAKKWINIASNKNVEGVEQLEECMKLEEIAYICERERSKLYE